MISRDDIVHAHELVDPHVRRTPLLDLATDDTLPAPVTLKLEVAQHAGSFKSRGAFYNLLSRDVPAAGVVAASGGNHGAAVAHAAGILGHRAKIFVPEISSPVKIARVRSYGAETIVGGASYAEAFRDSKKWAAESGAMELHAYDTAPTVAGQGTLARELANQIDGIDTVLIAVGGGGLIGGAAAWFRHSVRLVGVEPENAPTLSRAFAAGRPVDVEVAGVAADSLGAKRIGEIGFELAEKFVDDTCLVTDQAIVAAQRYLWQSARIIAEPGGVTALAAILSGGYAPGPSERVVVVVCGGNADLSVFA